MYLLCLFFAVWKWRPRAPDKPSRASWPYNNMYYTRYTHTLIHMYLFVAVIYVVVNSFICTPRAAVVNKLVVGHTIISLYSPNTAKHRNILELARAPFFAASLTLPIPSTRLHTYIRQYLPNIEHWPNFENVYTGVRVSMCIRNHPSRAILIAVAASHCSESWRTD